MGLAYPLECAATERSAPLFASVTKDEGEG